MKNIIDMLLVVYLNTSHVNVNPALISSSYSLAYNLNTSHVNVNQRVLHRYIRKYTI